MSQVKQDPTSAETSGALGLEQSYWETYEDYDWSSDETKDSAIQFIPKLEGDVLELCIGGGAFARRIPRSYSSYTGLDLSRTLLEALNKNLPHVKTVYGDAQELPFDDDSFDSIILFSGLHHLPKMRQSLEEAFRVLRPGGSYFCFEPNDRAWYRAPMRFLRNQKAVRDLIKIYSEDEVYLDSGKVAEQARAAGFDDIQVNFLTARFNPDFLGAMNKVFAQIMYTAGAMGDGANTQSYFALSARKAG